MTLHRTMFVLALAALSVAPVAAQESGSDAARVCLAPTRVKGASDNDAAMAAVRETFTSLLTGPTIGVSPLSARLESQAREEARQAGCPYILFTTLEQKHKEAHSLLGRIASGAVESGGYMAAARATTVAGEVAASAAAGAASAAVSTFAGSVKSEDEVKLSYRLESAGGKAIVKKSEKRKADSDGEDLLTPLVGEAAEAIAAAVASSEAK